MANQTGCARWKPEEVQVLLDNWRDKTVEEIQLLLPHRSRVSIHNKTIRLREGGVIPYREKRKLEGEEIPTAKIEHVNAFTIRHIGTRY